MAFTNPSKPAGLSPIKSISGTPWNSVANPYYIAPGDTNAYYPGDLVKLQTAGDPATGLSGITLGTAGATAIGVVVAVGLSAQLAGGGFGGPYINPNNLGLTYRPSGAQSAAYYALVVDDPNIIYEIQEGGAGTNLTQAAAGNNANIVYAAPAAGVSVSGTTLNNASVATTATLNLRILCLAQRADNHFVTNPATGGGGQKWWVMINNHQFSSGTTGV